MIDGVEVAKTGPPFAQVCGSPGNAMRYDRGSLGLRAGKHSFHLEGLHSASQGAPRLLWEGPGLPLTDVPPAAYSHYRAGCGWASGGEVRQPGIQACQRRSDLKGARGSAGGWSRWSRFHIFVGSGVAVHGRFFRVAVKLVSRLSNHPKNGSRSSLELVIFFKVKLLAAIDDFTIWARCGTVENR